MTIKVLPPEDAKKKAVAKVAKWKRAKRAKQKRRRANTPLPEHPMINVWDGTPHLHTNDLVEKNCPVQMVLQHSSLLDEKGREILPEREIVIQARRIIIGRNPQNNIVINNTMISRDHAILEIFMTPAGEVQAYIRDSGSVNGTFCNQEKVQQGTAQSIKEGDVIALGPDIKFKVKKLVDSSEVKWVRE